MNRAKPGRSKLKIIGSYLSPYVRKVLACLELKGLAYEIDPIVPFYGSSEFSGVSPLRRVPVLIDNNIVLSDSTVIVEYLNEKYLTPDLMPSDVAERGRARWIEEYADSRLGEVFIWHLYNQVVIRKFVWGKEPDEAILAKALTCEIPELMDYLETQLPDSGFLFGNVTIADISVASFFRNAAFARYQLDESRWPKVCRYVQDLLQMDCFTKLHQFELICLKTPIQQHRQALLRAGAPISEHTFGTDTPQAGIVSI
ncbi:glutathione S-transferase family protein [Zhongshania aquimaris]|uniref:Glutathione S-transferase family protein n=1 Tax=Zhongshania aquimaris TaxID=2857107 RepID=A0ABS6VSR7_9GAMM|nr:glutathione S-transferase family protein [Zhongshania aquimaris]